MVSRPAVPKNEKQVNIALELYLFYSAS